MMTWYQPEKPESAFVSCVLLDVSWNPVTDCTWSRPLAPVHVHVHVRVDGGVIVGVLVLGPVHPSNMRTGLSVVTIV